MGAIRFVKEPGKHHMKFKCYFIGILWPVLNVWGISQENRRVLSWRCVCMVSHYCGCVAWHREPALWGATLHEHKHPGQLHCHMDACQLQVFVCVSRAEGLKRKQKHICWKRTKNYSAGRQIINWNFGKRFMFKVGILPKVSNQIIPYLLKICRQREIYIP